MRDWLSMEQDIRPQKGGWAPGGYICKCSKCGGEFIGDKRAIECSRCAYEDDKAMDDMFARAKKS